MGNLSSNFKSKCNKSLKGESDKLKCAVTILEREKYKYKRKLGMGAFGDVIEVRSLDQKRFKYAAKIVSSKDCSHVELEMWRLFKHDSVVPLLEIIQECNINIFLMPLHKLTMIQAMEEKSFIKSAKSFNVTKYWIADVLRGLEYLHGINVCHADLKINNILITNRGNAVICDFSFSCLMTGNIKEYGLPRFFRPPEAFFPDDELDPVNGENFDLWSVGMLAFFTWTRTCSDGVIPNIEYWKKLVYPVLFDCLQFQRFNNLVKEFFPKAVITFEEISQALNLIQGILQYEAEKRPRASIILKHPLLNKEASLENLLEVSSIWTCEHFHLLNDLENDSNDMDEWFDGTENEPSLHDYTNFDTFTRDSPKKRMNDFDEHTFNSSLSFEFSPRTMGPTDTEVLMEDLEDRCKESLSSKDYKLSNAEVTNHNLSSKRNVTKTSDFCLSHLQYLGYSMIHELLMTL